MKRKKEKNKENYVRTREKIVISKGKRRGIRIKKNIEKEEWRRKRTK